jgi:hypothetical protein
MHRRLLRPEVDGSARGRTVPRPVPRTAGPVRMSPALRTMVFVTCAVLWGSGALWLVLHFAFAQRTQFGPLPNPWEPAVMRLHGLVAACVVFLLGWIAAGHVLERWGAARNRRSGLMLASCAALLIASGYPLYYTTGTLHDVAALTHEWLGIASLLAALAHWLRVLAAR